MSAMIRMQRAGHRYGEVAALSNLDLDVTQGELLALVGGSGSGKTTTLKLMNRLLDATEGSVSFEGRDVSQTAPPELRRRIGYAFQGIGLFPHMRVRENVAITPQLLGWSAADIRTRVDEVLSLVELEPTRFGDRMPHELSGGQAQRVGFARALAARPKLLLLDEPFGALDPLTRARLQQNLDRIRRQLELTVVLVTHDLAEALALADRVAVLHEGRLVQCCPPATLLAKPANDQVAAMIEAATWASRRALSQEAPRG